MGRGGVVRSARSCTATDAEGARDEEGVTSGAAVARPSVGDGGTEGGSWDRRRPMGPTSGAAGQDGARAVGDRGSSRASGARPADRRECSARGSASSRAGTAASAASASEGSSGAADDRGRETPSSQSTMVDAAGEPSREGSGARSGVSNGPEDEGEIVAGGNGGTEEVGVSVGVRPTGRRP